MVEIETVAVEGFKKVLRGSDAATGLITYIAIHSSDLGPALGGLRIYPYLSEEDAKEDVLRLAKAMTYKAAACKCGLGGGKSVIIADPRIKSPALLHAYARVLDSLKGEYIVAEDIGSTVTDMEVIHEKTPYVAARAFETSSGDPSRYTAWGIFRGMQAMALDQWGSISLKGKTILVQGIGNVGHKLLRILFWEGANLLISEINPDKINTYGTRYGATIIPPEEVFDTPCDIFSPCAFGDVINDRSIGRLTCAMIAGSANNQLSHNGLGEKLYEQHIVYAPDFIINAGGLINAASEFDTGGYNPKAARDRVDHIYDVILEILQRSRQEKKSTNQVAGEIAEYNLHHGIGKRTSPIHFT